MFYPERMQTVLIAVSKTKQRDVIEELYRLKALHVKGHSAAEGLPIGLPLGDAEELSQLLLRFRAIKTALGIEKEEAGPEAKLDIEKTRKLEKKLSAQISPLQEELKNVSERLNSENGRLESLKFLQKAGIGRLDVLQEYAGLEMVSGYMKGPGEFREKNSMVFAEKGKAKEKAVVVLTKREQAGKVKDRLSKTGFSEYRPDVKGEGPVSEAIEKQKKVIESLSDGRDKAEEKLAEVKENNEEEILDSIYWLRERLKVAELPLKLGTSDYAVLISGWVPKKKERQVMAAIRKTAPNAYIHFAEAHEAPTKIDNPKLVEPFEFFVNLYSTPSYREIDPSFLIFLTFPMFYGMILGDIGYGLIVLLLAIGIRLKTAKIRALVDASILSAFAAIAFGFLFGEFFGTEELFGYHLEPLLSRVHDLNSVLLLSVMIGLVHIGLGYLFAIKNEIGHNWKHAILGKGGWLLIELAFAFLLFDLLFKIRFLDTMASFGILGIGAILVALGEGVMYLIEIPSLLSNIVSYTRLAAFGLAATSIAIVVNTTAGQMFEEGGALAAGGVAILVVGHAFNLVLAMLDSFLQSLRLHYVEMFSKFYKGAGKAYRPFGEKG